MIGLSLALGAVQATVKLVPSRTSETPVGTPGTFAVAAPPSAIVQPLASASTTRSAAATVPWYCTPPLAQVAASTAPQTVSGTPDRRLWTAHPRSSRLYQLMNGTPVIAGMFRNMPAMVVTLATSHAATSPVKADPRKRSLMSVTFPTFQPLRSSLKLVAFWNMPLMSVTLATFQLPIASSKDVAPSNMPRSVVALPTFQLRTPTVSAVAFRKVYDRSAVAIRFGASVAEMVRFSAPSKLRPALPRATPPQWPTSESLRRSPAAAKRQPSS